MKCLGFAGIFVVLMAAACGTESAHAPAPSNNASATNSASVADDASGMNNASGTSAAAAAEPGSRGADSAKPSAPVIITASITPGAADVSLEFGSDATSVTVKVWGVDGLQVTSGATPAVAGSVTRGQSMRVPVQFTAPTTESNLAVSVSGTFGGREQVKVQSFTINPGSPPAHPSMGESQVDSNGRRVKVIKAQ